MLKALRRSGVLCIALVFVIAACNQTIKPVDVIGKWDYVKVENPYSPNPPDTVSAQELKDKAPYIRLNQNDSLVMMWGGKVLSYGKYRVEGNNIQYTETMPDGKTRTFPFYISKLTAAEMVFETKEDDAIRVTARKAER